ncbi:unnamed protein product [Darwinula stevensoni]|uniref:Uncharacterized protein n=1 Tax=Darwinula stevensoni TaxID=69355 RepID=A0A7R9FQS8_9CRUS|nr:unnamed protein product [Darwinula stevensoni]CAG0900081.1 unnamed protein product [Darwinula stevensoni]
MKVQKNAPWIYVEKLPPVYGDRQIPSNVKNMGKIFFRWKVPVFFYQHTSLILWELDRVLAGLPPLSPGFLV